MDAAEYRVKGKPIHKFSNFLIFFNTDFDFTFSTHKFIEEKFWVSNESFSSNYEQYKLKKLSHKSCWIWEIEFLTDYWECVTSF